MIASQAARASPKRFLVGKGQKPVDPITVPQDALDAYRRTQPLFTEFLLASGRVVVENIPE